MTLEDELGSGKKKGQEKGGTPPAASRRAKGDVVERVVAMMHEAPGLTVHRDVLLPAKNREGHRRQIDVLVLGSFGGYPAVHVIECKNFGRPINVRDVGTFKDLLEDVGYAPQQGILVSASSIGSGAATRAREIGMKVFELRGLTPDKLSSALHEAKQRIVFAVPSLSGFMVASDGAGPGSPPSAHSDAVFFDENGRLADALPDMVWMKWLEGEPPSSLGEHVVPLETEGLHLRVETELVRVEALEARVKVIGIVLVLPGTATEHALLDPDGLGVQKYKANASFDPAPGTYPVRVFEEEEDLEGFLVKDEAAIRLTVGRLRTPRIRMDQVWWPPSQRVLDRIRELEELHRQGKVDPSDGDALRGIEGTDLTEAWETVSPQYLVRARPREEEGAP